MNINNFRIGTRLKLGFGMILLLLVAMVAAVALTLRKRKNVRKIDPAEQISVKRDDRVRIVSMRSEKD